MSSELTEDQAKLTARIVGIEAELEKVDKKHLKAMIRANDFSDQKDNLLCELTPLKNGFWQSKKIIGEPCVIKVRSKSSELAMKQRTDEMWDRFLDKINDQGPIGE